MCELVDDGVLESGVDVPLVLLEPRSDCEDVGRRPMFSRITVRFDVNCFTFMKNYIRLNILVYYIIMLLFITF